MNAKVLVNRPLQQATETVDFLEAKGIKALAAPSLSIIPVVPLAPLDAEFALITSANVLSSLKKQRRDFPFLAVGKATADSAQAMGFTNVRYAGGDGASLIKLCRELNLNIEKGMLISGEGTDGSMYGDPIVEALKIRRTLGYRVANIDSLCPLAQKSLLNRDIEVILTYSAQSACTFLEIAADLLREQSSNIRVVCLAERIAESWTKKSAELGIKKWRDILVYMPPHKIDFTSF